jgi:hypothetical protein
MKKTIIYLLIIFAALFLLNLAMAKTAAQVTVVETAEAAEATSTPVAIGPVLSHQQEVWIYVLEWCESRGVKTAINQVDRDGTASYYSFQFKPSTFRGYGVKYGVVATSTTQAELGELLKSYELQRSIVSHMIGDPSVNWYQQFPDCVRKYGLPPKN